MRVLFDISALGYGALGPAFRTGVYRVVENLALSLMARGGGVATRFCAADSPEAWALAHGYWKDGPLAASEFVPESGGGLYGPLQRTLTNWNRNPQVSPIERLGRRALREVTSRLREKVPCLDQEDFKGYVYHSPYYAFPEISRGRPRVLTLHDLISLRYPEVSSGSREYLRTIVDSIEPNDRVVCVSEWTRKELLEYAPSLDPAMVSAIGWAADDSFRPMPAKAVEIARVTHNVQGRPYFLCVGTEEKRKNLPMLIQAFDSLLARRPDCEARLALIGAAGSDTKAVEVSAKGKSRIVRLGFVENHELPALYTGALAYAFPSLYEGFGLPALEAMACGTAVLASDSSALTTVVGEGGWLLPPRDPEAWSHALERIYDSEPERESWRAKGAAWVRRFSWKQTADQYASLYKKMLSN